MFTTLTLGWGEARPPQYEMRKVQRLLSFTESFASSVKCKQLDFCVPVNTVLQQSLFEEQALLTFLSLRKSMLMVVLYDVLLFLLTFLLLLIHLIINSCDQELGGGGGRRGLQKSNIISSG